MTRTHGYPLSPPSTALVLLRRNRPSSMLPFLLLRLHVQRSFVSVPAINRVLPASVPD